MTRPVAINGRFLTRPTTGVDRFAAEVLRKWLPQFGGARRARIVVPASAVLSNPPPAPGRVDRVGSFAGHAWEQLDLARHCREDILISLCNAGPVLHRSQLVVLHDAAVMAHPETYSFAYRQWYRWLHRQLIRRSRMIATVSSFSASEFMRYFGAAASRMEVVCESGEHILHSPSVPSILERLQLVDRDYMLVVGSRTPNKNFGAVLKAVQLLNDTRVKVVAVGGGNQRVFAGVELSAECLVPAGYVTDGELRALYEHALCFVFPSLYEGFGLPPLEAMHCGCPTLVSRSASLPEVCAEASAYCDPYDPRDIAKQLGKLLSSAAMRAELRQAGLERTRRFTWERAALQLQEIIHKMD
jgi:glycosyltransferase involved in cell wall biosynthesis